MHSFRHQFDGRWEAEELPYAVVQEEMMAPMQDIRTDEVGRKSELLERDLLGFQDQLSMSVRNGEGP